MKNLFSENRLVYRGGGESPRPREAAQESSEVPKGKMFPLAKKMVKDMLDGNNGLSTRKFSKLKSQPEKQKKMIEKWLKDHGLDKKQKDNFMGTDKITEYYIGGKKVNPSKVASEVHTFMKNKENQKKIMAEIKKERQAKSSAERSEGFQENNSWPSQKAADIASSFYSSSLQKAIDKAKTKIGARAKTMGSGFANKIKNKINKIIEPGAHIANINSMLSIGGEDIKFNGPKAWPMINTSTKRRRLQSKIIRSIG